MNSALKNAIAIVDAANALDKAPAGQKQTPRWALTNLLTEHGVEVARALIAEGYAADFATKQAAAVAGEEQGRSEAKPNERTPSETR